MTKIEETQKKKDVFSTFFEELRRNSLTVTVLAIVTGLLAGGLIAAVTTEGVYVAFRVSFFEGIKAGFMVFWNTYKALFTGSVGVPADIASALRSGDGVAINKAFTPFFESRLQATPYIFAGLAVALAFKGGLFNIGAEGQLALGALAAAWLGYGLPKALGTTIPAIIHVCRSFLSGVVSLSIVNPTHSTKEYTQCQPNKTRLLSAVSSRRA